MRRTFLSWFILVLAICAGAFFAFMAGVPQTIFHNDLSYMSSAIVVVFIGTAAWIGRIAWREERSARWGHVAGLICPALGMLGTAIGLSMQAKALAGGSTSFLALATSLYSTGCGIAAFIGVTVLTFIVESGQ